MTPSLQEVGHVDLHKWGEGLPGVGWEELLDLARIQAVEMNTRSTNLMKKLQGGRSNSSGTNSGVNQLLRDQDLQKRRVIKFMKQSECEQSQTVGL